MFVTCQSQSVAFRFSSPMATAFTLMAIRRFVGAITDCCTPLPTDYNGRIPEIHWIQLKIS
jgi:hypothetical protein